ncbi:MAG: alpha/beta fold hydrolase [Pseudomonadota bacterium]
MARQTQRLTFKGSQGLDLAARLDLPEGRIRAFALFAHCFTCSKDLFSVTRISSELARQGIAVLRFDFTGLGQSGGDFANTNFSSNVGDIIAAVDHMRETYEAPALLIGHSLGGAAVLCAAGQVPEVKGVVTIGAPSDAAHVVEQFGADISRIEEDGEAQVSLAGRPFFIRKQFLDDVRAQSIREHIRSIDAALLVLHSPTDQTVGIENASNIFLAAKHPKSFVSLDGADHLLTDKRDGVFAAQLISSWSARYLDLVEPAEEHEALGVRVAETGGGKFQQFVTAGPHRLLADEPTDVGGLGSGPTPYEFVAIGLAACTSMTLRMYAEFKKIDLGRISVEVDHAKAHAGDVEKAGGKIDVFQRHITIEGDLDDAMRAKVLQIADRCPVHRTLEATAKVETDLTAL